MLPQQGDITPVPGAASANATGKVQEANAAAATQHQNSNSENSNNNNNNINNNNNMTLPSLSTINGGTTPVINNASSNAQSNINSPSSVASGSVSSSTATDSRFPSIPNVTSNIASTILPSIHKRKSSSGFSLASFDNPLPPPPLPQQQHLHNNHNNVTGTNATTIEKSKPDINIKNDHHITENNSDAAVEDGSYRPLNVKDALSYLEQVKLQFNSKPFIYNQFLDIMKDFKSQSIDTPGVIERVSTLFNGYPILIQGFNTFLPQGYRIDCTNNPEDPITVTTPMGTSTIQDSTLKSISTTTTTNNNNNNNTNMIANVATASTNVTAITESNNNNNNNNNNMQNQSTNDNQIQSNLPPPPISQYSANQPQQSSMVGLQSSQGLPQPNQSMDQQKKPNDVEFSQAISYVNKIKNRFADQPDVYKSFLEILQTYQREQKPINEVYAQVTVLFQNAPDLLEDFKKFLPDSSASADQQQQIYQNGTSDNNNYMYNGMTAYYPTTANQQQQQQQNLPPIGSFSPPTNGNMTVHDEYNKNANPPINEQQTGVELPSIIPPEQAIAAAATNAAKAAAATTSTGAATTDENIQQQETHPYIIPNVANENVPLSDLRGEPITNEQYASNEGMAANQFAQQQHQQMIVDQHYGHPNEIPVRPEIDLDPSIVPVVPEPTEPIENNLTLVEETNFFEKAKKHIGNKQIYTEFLKILNLFSQDLINVDELVSKVENYLGSQPELFSWFKNFVGFQDKPKIIENIVHEKHRLDLDLCEAYGPSYKKLPKTDTFMPCSGRDDMCWEVLNDEWVGHPVWASEDSGFIAHRKNQYEETLFKIEEERHEYDFYIESNLRTIQTLETIANRISNMTEEEKQSFKLPPGLGHTSLTIYRKVIRKVYDKERGFEIIDALHEYPGIAVPVVLKRLKQKDEEWRRAQREWNKVWRELEQKVYYKSLDHLGLTFKQADKKLLTTKQLISEISSIKVDQNNKRMHWLTPKPKSQLDFQFDDFDIFYDIIALADVFIDHSSIYSNPDKYRLKDLLRSVISLFFSIPVEKVKKAIEDRIPKTEKKKDTEKKETESNKKRVRSDVEVSLSDILNRSKYQKLKIVSKDNEGEDDESEEEAERLAKEADMISEQESRKPWLIGNIVDTANSSGAIVNRNIFNMFANTNIYIFFRHWTTIYQRLFECKKMNEKVTKDIGARKVVQFAEDLNLVSTQIKDMGLDFVGKDSYQELLALSKRLIENDLEHQWFEESLRQAFNNKAFKMYTVDKVIQSLVKHAHSLMGDNKTAEIMALFEKDRLQTSTSTKEQIFYRLQTRSHMSSTENMFRIEYNREKRHVCIQYIAIDDLTLNDAKTKDDKWKYYITSYALPHPTEGIDQDKLFIPFLERILEFETEALDVENPTDSRYSPEGTSSSRLKIRINKDTYSLDIEPGSYDVFSRTSINKHPIKVNDSKYKNRLEKKKDMVNSFLGGKYGWKKGLSEAEISKIEPKPLVSVESNSIAHTESTEAISTGMQQTIETEAPQIETAKPSNKESDQINATTINE